MKFLHREIVEINKKRACPSGKPSIVLRVNLKINQSVSVQLVLESSLEKEPKHQLELRCSS